MSNNNQLITDVAVQGGQPNSKKFLIREAIEQPLTKTNDGKYMFEGMCANFERNNNGRIYDRDDYLSHLKILREKAQSNRLLGELDHPEGFAVSMKNVSHKIVDLYYEEKSDTVRIKIELLDTPEGKKAKAIADAGVPLHISSRASGYITESGDVTLDNIYTYDIVDNPGFADAQLNRVNEMFAGKDINRNLIYITEWVTNDNKKAIKVDNRTKTRRKRRPNTLNESVGSNQAIIKYLDMTADHINGITDRMDDMASKFRSQSTLEQKLDKLVQFVDMIAERVNQLTDYSNYIAENFNESVNEHNQLIEYTNTISKFANKLADHNDLIVEQVNGLADHNDLIVERVNVIGDHNDLIVERVNKLHAYANTSAGFSNRLAESIEKLTGKSVNESAQTKRRSTRINESTTDKPVKRTNEAIDLNALGNVIDNTVFSLNQQKVNETISRLYESYPFLIGLDTKDIQAFNSLNENTKAKVVGKIKKVATNERLTVQRIAGMINEAKDNPASGITDFIPENLVPTWNALSDKERQQLVGLSKFKNLRSAYEIEMFWESVLVEKPGLTRLNENDQIHQEAAQIDINNLGYGEDTIDSLLQF
jgi:DNA-binding ferritin-like protein